MARLAALALACLVAACASTTTSLESQWRDPAAGPVHFEKIAALALMPEAATSRSLEDELVKRIPGAIAGYTLVPDEARADTNDVKARVLASGADGAIVLRLVNRRQESQWVPGGFPPAYYSPWGYHGFARPTYVEPGYMHVDEVLKIETNVYDVKREKLVWSGLTSSVSPGSIQELVGDLMEVVCAALREQGLVAGP